VTDAEVLATVEAAFAAVPRPARTHEHLCEECDEHASLLASRDHQSLAHDDIGPQSWDPITGVTPQAFAYWMPALVRYAFAPPHEKWGWYGGQLFFHLAFDGRHNVRWQYCTQQQRQAVRILLEHLAATRADLIDEEMCRPQFYHAVDAWAE
jgi:hypothetical protein